MIPIIDRELCTGCGACIEICPPRALVMEQEIARLEEEFCEECGFCAAECSVGAITIPSRSAHADAKPNRLRVLYQFAFKMDDPATGWVPRAAARR